MEIYYPPTTISLPMDTRSREDLPDCVDDDFQAQTTHMNRMKSEKNRLDTYKTWPPAISQRPAELARAGLFYTLTNDRVQCPFCYGVLKDWRPEDQPFTEHARHFAQCRFIRGMEVGNIPIFPLFVTTPQVNIAHVGHSPAALNIVPPYATNVVIAGGSPVHIGAMGDVDYTREENRLTTFTNWPSHLPQQPEVLSRAGFYHHPSNEKLDRVKCAYCRGKLFNWQPEDDPHIEHARYFPECPYITLCLGVDVVRDLRNTAQPTSLNSIQFEQQTPPCHHVSTGSSSHQPPNCDTLATRMRSEPVQAVLEMGFRDDVVRQTVEKCLAERRGNFPLADELAAMVMQMEATEQPVNQAAAPQQRLMANPSAGSSGSAEPSQEQIWRQYRDPSNTPEKIREENLQMKEKYLCKVCMENQVRVTFMPCGHLACCGPCSMTLSECPICRQRISGCVRTYF